MFKPMLLLIVVFAMGSVAGYVYGTKHPSVGDCVNSVIGG